MSFCVNISYCAQHFKGGSTDVGGTVLHGETHARWLLEAVRWYKSNFPVTATVLVSMTGWPGMLRCEVSPNNLERDVMWEVWREARLLGVPDNGHHQSGAAWCLRMGLEAAAKLGHEVMLHTAEDVLADGGDIYDLIGKCIRGYDYAGEAWGHHQEFLNSQFFACRVQSLVPYLDPCVVNGEHHLEKYLKELLEGKKVWTGPHCYKHTHNPEEGMRWLRGESVA